MAYYVRPTREDDFSSVFGLLQQLWSGRPLNREAVERVFLTALASDRHVYLCAVSKDGVVGFGSLSLLPSLRLGGTLGHLDELVVDAEMRGRGIGTELLAGLSVAARDRGCRHLELNSGFQRESAHRFYERLGFVRRAFHFYGPPLPTNELNA